jgi:hypothetical protein
MHVSLIRKPEQSIRVRNMDESETPISVSVGTLYPGYPEGAEPWMRADFDWFLTRDDALALYHDLAEILASTAPAAPRAEVAG